MLSVLVWGAIKLVEEYSTGSVAIIPVKGTITLEGCGGNIFGSTRCASVPTIKDMLDDANGDRAVKAIVLDINSGGGYVVASRQLMQAIKESEKPVVAYISESGASGAYYAASAADDVVADRHAITGSLGVVMEIQHYYGLFEKIGVNVTMITAGEYKDIGSPYRSMTETEKEKLTKMVNQIHEDFISDVAANRGMDVESVRKVADGSIYLGIDAKQLGLVDELGDRDDAIMVAAALGGIEGTPRVKEITQKVSLLDALSGMQAGGGLYQLLSVLPDDLFVRKNFVAYY